jgi:mycofactocin precursor
MREAVWHVTAQLVMASVPRKWRERARRNLGSPEGRDSVGLCPEEVGMLAEDQARDQDVCDGDDDELSDDDVEELLVEEVSIDGMCGVY